MKVTDQNVYQVIQALEALLGKQGKLNLTRQSPSTGMHAVWSIPKVEYQDGRRGTVRTTFGEHTGETLIEAMQKMYDHLTQSFNDPLIKHKKNLAQVEVKQKETMSLFGPDIPLDVTDVSVDDMDDLDKQIDRISI